MMKQSGTRRRWARRMICAWLVGPIAACQAQLAVTEVMSWAAVTFHGASVPQQSDWWELTNFGDRTNLTGWFWTDNGRAPFSDASAPFRGLVLEHNESVVFFRARETPNEAQFRAWWGGCLSPSTKVIPWNRPGLNNDTTGDEVWVFDSRSNLVDFVSFGAALIGVTFTSDPQSGEFGIYSAPNGCGVCQAATADDIGSPGVHCGAIPLRIVQQPTNVVVDAGDDAIFCVKAIGLPRPRYQWLSNGVVMPGANAASLTLAEAQPGNAASYQVIVSNGLERVVSAAANLTVSTTPHAPQFVTKLEDIDVFEGEDATFAPRVRVYPAARYQWHSNGVVIAGATNRNLTLRFVKMAANGSRFWVKTWNGYGTTNTTNQLLVQPWPRLEITEAFPSQSLQPASVPRRNWWELSNLGTNTVRLGQARHSDRPSFVGARVLTDRVEMRPGEAVIFVDTLTREEFLDWWGRTNFPSDVRIVTYGGYGLSEWSDALHVWSAAGNLLASVSYASPTPFPDVPATCPCGPCDEDLCDVPINGRSLYFDEADEVCWAWMGRASRENVNGAFRAARSDDVGSPGIHKQPVLLSISMHGAAWLRARVIAGRSYQLLGAETLQHPVWLSEGSYTAGGSLLILSNRPLPSPRQRFYRLRETP